MAASTLAKVAASSAFASVSTTKLLTVEEMLEALRSADGMAYRAPGAASQHRPRADLPAVAELSW